MFVDSVSKMLAKFSRRVLSTAAPAGEAAAGTHQGAAAAWVKRLVAGWEYCILVSKMQYFHWFFKVLQNRAGVPAGKKSPKGDFLHNNHHDNVI